MYGNTVSFEYGNVSDSDSVVNIYILLISRVQPYSGRDPEPTVEQTSRGAHPIHNS